MATIIDSAELDSLQLDDYQWHQSYNCLDCCVTVEVWQARQDHFDDNTRMTYLNEKDMQAPCLEMQLRGIRLDEVKVSTEIATLWSEIRILEEYFAELMQAVYGRFVNWRSPQQVKEMLNAMGWTCRKTDRPTLEALRAHFYAEPIILAILGLRDRDKLHGVLAKTNRRRTGRFHAAFKVPGTSTGRLSSAKDPFNEGHNLQNLNDRTRRCFIPDDGMKFAYIDLEQAESRAVAYLSGDENYIHACESGDLHTSVSEMVWPELAWTDDPKKNKAIAEEIFYRFFTYRDMAKRGGHATNYYGKAFTVAKHLNVQKQIIEAFQERYLEKFSGIPEWWYRVMKDLMTQGWLMTPFGRFRRFFGRPDDDATIRKAIAFEPQSLVGDIENTGMWRVWRWMEVQMLAQVHDAILFQFPEEQESEIITTAVRHIEIPIAVGSRTMTIPCEPKTGWNWGAYDESDNPAGLKKWTGRDDRTRPEPSAIVDTMLA